MYIRSEPEHFCIPYIVYIPYGVLGLGMLGLFSLSISSMMLVFWWRNITMLYIKYNIWNTLFFDRDCF